MCVCVVFLSSPVAYKSKIMRVTTIHKPLSPDESIGQSACSLWIMSNVSTMADLEI